MDRQFKPPRYAGGPEFLQWLSQIDWALMSTPGCINIRTDGNLPNATPGEPDHGDDYPMDDQVLNDADPPVMVNIRITAQANYKALTLIMTCLSPQIFSMLSRRTDVASKALNYLKQ
eukprot:gene4899-34664_t